MIPVLRSIDSLLNRFDELSQRHVKFISNFNTDFPDVENPLRHVARAEEEQQKTVENIISAANKNDDETGFIGSVDDFNRRIIKIRHLHRPPSYSPNDGSVFPRASSRTSLIITQSTSLPYTSGNTMVQLTSKSITPQPVASIVGTEKKVELTTNIKPRVVPQNLPASRRYARSAVTVFTMETVNRLSKPKKYHRFSEQKSIIKRVRRRPKSCENTEKIPQPSASSSTSVPPTQIKRTNPTIIKSSPKKFKVENKIPLETPKKIPVNNPVRPLLIFAPTISLTFPTQPQQQSSCIDIRPKTTVANKRSMIH